MCGVHAIHPRQECDVWTVPVGQETELEPSPSPVLGEKIKGSKGYSMPWNGSVQLNKRKELALLGEPMKTRGQETGFEKCFFFHAKEPSGRVVLI